MLISEQITDAKTGETITRMVEMPGVMSPEEAVAVDLANRCEEVRAERNRRLLACDWTVLPDAPLDDAQRADWLKYRTALRDVTEQAGFPEVRWPDLPGDQASRSELEVA